MLKTAVVVCLLVVAMECQNVPAWYSGLVSLRNDVPQENALILQDGSQTQNSNVTSDQSYPENGFSFQQAYPGSVQAAQPPAAQGVQQPATQTQLRANANAIHQDANRYTQTAISWQRPRAEEYGQTRNPTLDKQGGRDGRLPAGNVQWDGNANRGTNTPDWRAPKAVHSSQPGNFAAPGPILWENPNSGFRAEAPVGKLSFKDPSGQNLQQWRSPLLQTLNWRVDTAPPTASPTGRPQPFVQKLPALYMNAIGLDSQTGNKAGGEQIPQKLSASGPLMSDEIPTLSSPASDGGQTSDGSKLPNQPMFEQSQTMNLASDAQTPERQDPQIQPSYPTRQTMTIAAGEQMLQGLHSDPVPTQSQTTNVATGRQTLRAINTQSLQPTVDFQTQIPDIATPSEDSPTLIPNTATIARNNLQTLNTIRNAQSSLSQTGSRQDSAMSLMENGDKSTGKDSDSNDVAVDLGDGPVVVLFDSSVRGPESQRFPGVTSLKLLERILVAIAFVPSRE